MAGGTWGKITNVDLTLGHGFPMAFTVAGTAAIQKFTVMTLSDPFTVASVSNADAPGGYIYGGIAAEEIKIADAQTRMTCWTDVIADAFASGAISVGQPVASCGNNRFCAISLGTTAASNAVLAGWCRETASDNEQVAMRLIRY